jgi:hypothetical protein
MDTKVHEERTADNADGTANVKIITDKIMGAENGFDLNGFDNPLRPVRPFAAKQIRVNSCDSWLPLSVVCGLRSPVSGLTSDC